MQRWQYKNSHLMPILKRYLKGFYLYVFSGCSSTGFIFIFYPLSFSGCGGGLIFISLFGHAAWRVLS